MRRNLTSIAALLIVASVLAGCGNDDEPSRAPAPPNDTSQSAATPDANAPATQASEEDLATGLLNIDDVPTGWAEMPYGDDGDEADYCGGAINEVTNPVEDRPDATVAFALDEDAGPAIYEAIGFAAPGTGTDLVADLEAVIGGCEPTEVDGLDTQVSQMSFPTLGDRSVGFKVHIEDPDSGIAFDFVLVYVANDDLITMVGAYDRSVDGGPTDLLEKHAPLAVDRAEEALL